MTSTTFDHMAGQSLEALELALLEQRREAEILEKALGAELADHEEVKLAAERIMKRAPGLLQHIVTNVYKSEKKWKNFGRAADLAAGGVAGGLAGNAAGKYAAGKYNT